MRGDARALRHRILHEPPQLAERLRRLAQPRRRRQRLGHEALHHGPRRVPDIVVRIQVARDALDDDHRLLQEHELGLHPHPEGLGDLEELAQQRRHRDLARGPPEDAFADRAQRLREGVDRAVGRDERDVEMDLGDASVVAVQEAVERLGHEAAHDRIDAPHDAEIDRDQVAVRGREQIPLMHVGMEEAVAQGVGQEAPDDRVGQPLPVDPGGVEARMVAQGQALDPFSDEDPLGRQLPVGLRHAEARIALRVLGHLGRRRAFQAQIHLEAHALGQRVDEGDGAKPPRLGRDALGRPRGQIEALEIRPEPRLHARPQRLDRDVAVRALDPRAMDLRDRGGRHRLRERLEDRLDGLAERGRDLGLGLRRRERGHLVLQRRQVVGERAAHDVRPGREELPQLHVGRPQLAQRLREARARRRVGPAPPGRQPQEPRADPRGPRRLRLDLVRQQHVVLRHHARGGQQPEGGGDPSHGSGGPVRRPAPASPLLMAGHDPAIQDPRRAAHGWPPRGRR